jgi:hypothetical protein
MQEKSGRWDSNPRPSRWQRDALPLSYARIFWPAYFGPQFIFWPAMSHKYKADDEIRTRDIQLGKLTLYQLSYIRTLLYMPSNTFCASRLSRILKICKFASLVLFLWLNSIKLPIFLQAFLLFFSEQHKTSTLRSILTRCTQV